MMWNIGLRPTRRSGLNDSGASTLVVGYAFVQSVSDGMARLRRSRESDGAKNLVHCLQVGGETDVLPPAAALVPGR